MSGGAAVLGSNLVDSLVPVVDEIRTSLNQELGIRAWRMFAVTRTWSGERIGEGEYTETQVEFDDPQPMIGEWDGQELKQMTCGIDDNGSIDAAHVSMTYTHEQVAGGTLGDNQQFYIKLTEAHGQGQPDRYYRHARPPEPDRRKGLSWNFWLERVRL